MAPTRNKRSNIRARASKAKSYDPRGKYAPLPNNGNSTEELDAEVEPVSEPTISTKRKREASDFDDDTPWRLNKRDKRAIKHNILLSKVRDSAIQKNPPKTLKRRRPGNKLKADIGSLVDALPDLNELDQEDPGTYGSEDEWEGVSSDENDQTMQFDGSTAGSRKRRKRPTKSEGKIVMTGLRHRPGAMKRKRKMEDAEMERFRRNLARMASGSGSQAAAAAQMNVRPAEGSKAAASATHADRWAALRGFIGSTMEREKGFAAVG